MWDLANHPKPNSYENKLLQNDNGQDDSKSNINKLDESVSNSEYKYPTNVFEAIKSGDNDTTLNQTRNSEWDKKENAILSNRNLSEWDKKENAILSNRNLSECETDRSTLKYVIIKTEREKHLVSVKEDLVNEMGQSDQLINNNNTTWNNECHQLEEQQQSDIEDNDNEEITDNINNENLVKDQQEQPQTDEYNFDNRGDVTVDDELEHNDNFDQKNDIDSKRQAGKDSDSYCNNDKNVASNQKSSYSYITEKAINFVQCDGSDARTNNNKSGINQDKSQSYMNNMTDISIDAPKVNLSQVLANDHSENQLENISDKEVSYNDNQVKDASENLLVIKKGGFNNGQSYSVPGKLNLGERSCDFAKDGGLVKDKGQKGCEYVSEGGSVFQDIEFEEIDDNKFVEDENGVGNEFDNDTVEYS